MLEGQLSAWLTYEGADGKRRKITASRRYHYASNRSFIEPMKEGDGVEDSELRWENVSGFSSARGWIRSSNFARWAVRVVTP